MLVDGVVMSVRVSEDIVKACEKIGSRQKKTEGSTDHKASSLSYSSKHRRRIKGSCVPI
jgi:hypothetical protein